MDTSLISHKREELKKVMNELRKRRGGSETVRSNQGSRLLGAIVRKQHAGSRTGRNVPDGDCREVAASSSRAHGRCSGR